MAQAQVMEQKTRVNSSGMGEENDGSGGGEHEKQQGWRGQRDAGFKNEQATRGKEKQNLKNWNGWAIYSGGPPVQTEQTLNSWH